MTFSMTRQSKVSSFHNLMMLSLNNALEGDENMHRTAGPNNI